MIRFGTRPIESEFGLLDCFELCRSKRRVPQPSAPCYCNGKECNSVCPFKPDFAQWLSDVNGLCFDTLAQISQAPLTLPQYIPLIHHGYCRHRPLDWPVVAIETYEVFRLQKGQYRALTQTPDELRRAFCLAPGVKVLLLGTADDPSLERYWEYRKKDDAAGQLAPLGVLAAIGPNFSHFLDVPRTDNLFNRKRQLICLLELHRAGICPIPHLSTVAPGDWRFWSQYLVTQPSVCAVALEFQTGNKNRAEGRKVLDRLTLLQQQVGRSLHLIMVGGGQFVEYAAQRFAGVTLVDSAPFMSAVKRRAFEERVARRSWKETYTLELQPLDDLLLANVTGYSGCLDSMIRSARSQQQDSGGAPRQPR